MKIAIILGTRPEIIKMSPIVRECERRNYDYFILHSGQHYSYELDKIFFEDLELPYPKYNIDVGSGSHGRETGKMIIGIEEILQKENPNIVLVQGDTNTVLAGSLSASKLNIPVCHVEAGLRSFDKKMPEEINRIVTDHISEFLFAPTQIARNNLLKEGISDEKILVTGNTIVDALNQNLEISNRKSNILKKIGIENNKYILATFHRQENVDFMKKLEGIIKGLTSVAEKSDLSIIIPLHPRTKKRLSEFNISIPKSLSITPPIGYLDFLQLESNSSLILTDSGGIQEEACILGVPCVTLRENTERPETIEVGSNILVGTNPENILNGAMKMLGSNVSWKNPFGDGNAGKLILKHILFVYGDTYESSFDCV